MQSIHRHNLAGAPDLRRGSTGEWVAYLQKLLAYHSSWYGYNGTVDSRFDGDVDQAVRRVQQIMAGEGHDQAVNGVVTMPVWVFLIEKASWSEGLDDTHGRKASGRWQFATSDELDYNEEMARPGWCQGSLQLAISDFKDDPYSGSVYVRFFAKDGKYSDEGEAARNGVVTMPRIWLPRTGMVQFYLQSHWEGIETIQGRWAEYTLPKGDPDLAFRLHQKPHQVEITVEEAEQRGYVRGWSVQQGGGFKITAGPAELSLEASTTTSGEESHGTEYRRSSKVTVLLPTDDLLIEHAG